MKTDRVFYLYMAFIGAVSGAIMVFVPGASDFSVKPFFWILIAVGLFDGAIVLRARSHPALMLSMNARIIGFGIGIAVMLGIGLLTGKWIGLL